MTSSMRRLFAAPGRLVGAAPRLSSPPKMVVPFYQSPEWRALVLALRRLRGDRCEGCGAAGSGKRLYGDHIVELKDGGAKLDPGNVRLLCGKCHGIKTARAKRARAGLA